MKKAKIKMKTKLYDAWSTCQELEYMSGVHEFQFMTDREKEDLRHFLGSIEGKEIDAYICHGGAFEREDNNWILPKSLWEYVEGE